jgi:hypothetical protein
MKEQIEALIKYLEDTNDFTDEFYLTYTGQLNDGDISDWHNNHFDDNIDSGVNLGQTMLAEEMINKLKAIVAGE